MYEPLPAGLPDQRQHGHHDEPELKHTRNKLERRLWRRGSLLDLARRCFRRENWSLEAVALFSCLLVTAIIVAVLYNFNGETLSAWSAPITLNAFISLLVTIFYMLLNLVLAKCIHQMRWIHYDESQQLLDFQNFDSVSNGGIGALRYLLSIPRSHRLNLAAILIITSASVGPLTQQILGFDTATFTTMEEASMPVIKHLQGEDPSYLQLSDLYVSDLLPNTFQTMITAAVYSGLFATSKQANFSVLPQCSSSNCTWDSYATLAIQSDTRNVTDKLDIMDPQNLLQQLQNQTSSSVGMSDNMTINTTGQAVSLPGEKVNRYSGYETQIPGIGVDQLQPFYEQAIGSLYPVVGPPRLQIANLTFFTVQTDSGLYSTNVVRNNNTSTGQTLERFYIFYHQIQINSTQDMNGDASNITIEYLKTEAWNCTFALTLQPMSGEQINGAFTERTVGPPMLYDGPPADLVTESVNYTWHGLRYWTDWTTYFSLADTLEDIFNVTTGLDWAGQYQTNDGQSQLLSTDALNENKLQGPASILYKLASDQSYDNDTNSSLTMVDAMNNVAKSLTSMFRSNSGDTAPGKVQRTLAIYRVRWAWISAPVIILVAAALLVAVTAVETRKRGLPTWTDSTLALAVHGIDEYSRMDLAKLRTLEELEEACKGIRVSLSKKSLLLETTN